MSKLQTVILTNTKELIGYSSQICTLFEECFSTKMSTDFWRWAYIENPFGNPIVAITLDGGKLVGHYAVIPYFLMNNKGEQIKSALSMTTMVAESHRKYYLFTSLAEDVYAEMKRQQYNIVCGFPNLLSVSGFRKRLGWKIGEPDFVASVTKQQLMSSEALSLFNSNKKRFGFNTLDQQQIEWRLKKPDFNYMKKKGNILKKYSDGYDLMSINEQNIDYLDEGKRYNVLLDSSIHDLKKYIEFEYQFGYRCISNEGENYEFDKSMLMSDVF